MNVNKDRGTSVGFTIDEKDDIIDSIKPYILEKSMVNGFDFYKYLHIVGGSGNWKGKKEEYLNGGEFTFCVFYASPDEMEGISMCYRIWCKEKKIPFGTGKTIREAYVKWGLAFKTTQP